MLAIIPARGGSKGVTGKNIKLLDNKPLIAHTIVAAKEAKCIDRVVVTTDDVKIAEVAKQYGAEVPFIRPKELATDTAEAPDVYLHAIDFLNQVSDETIEQFMVLLPTVPFRTAHHIQEAYDRFVQTKATTLVSVKKADIPPSWYLRADKDGKIHPCNFAKSIEETNNRQYSDNYYHNNGAIYILDYHLLREKRSYFCDNTYYYEMDRDDSTDIDTEDDFRYAEYIISKGKM